MRNLTIAPEVAAIFGEERAAQLRAGPYLAEYRCVTCRHGGLVDDGEPLVAGLDVYDGGARLWIQHAACGAGGVRHVGGQVPDPPAETTAHGVLFATMRPDGPRPGVVVEIAMAVLSVLGAGGTETLDLAFDGLSAAGFAPVARLDEPPEPERITWRVALPTAGRPVGRPTPGRPGGVYGRSERGRETLLEPLPPIPPGWVEAVAANRCRCGLYVASRVGLLGMIRQPGWLRQMEQFAAAGQVVGTTAAVV